ncbi:MAG: SulP family inorganic anion transporter, partial [Bacteroidota bacterium]
MNSNFFSHWQRDLPAAIVVFFVALPLCLGIALASGAPLFSGLIAGIVGGIIVGLLSGSQIGVSGPAAGLAAIVLVAIGELGGFENFLVAVVLGGLIQIGFGLLKAGVIGYYFPSSVIKGMLTGIGVIIILKQIPYFFGIEKT